MSADELRQAELARRAFGGYDPAGVEGLLERAARTVESLAARVEALRQESVELRAREADFEAAAARNEHKSQEQVVGEVLVTAHRAAESLIDRAESDAARILEDARRQVAPILAEAEHDREEAGRLQREAQATVEGARRHGATLVEMARAEREQLLAEALAETREQRAELEAERARLEREIKELRRGWAGFMTEALARLDAPPELEDEVEEHSTGDVVVDLQSRLPEGGAGTGS